jgi:hypothetical protein
MVFYLVVYTVVLKLFAVAIQRGGKCEPTRAQCTPRFGTNRSPSLPIVCCFSIPTKYAAFPGFLLVRDVLQISHAEGFEAEDWAEVSKPRPIKMPGEWESLPSPVMATPHCYPTAVFDSQKFPPNFIYHFCGNNSESS